MNLRTVLFDSVGRLRSGLRFAVFVTLFVLFLGAAGTITQRATPLLAEAGSAGFIALNAAVSLAVALGVGWFCGRYLEGLPFRTLGAWFTAGWARHILAGSLLGIATLGLAAAIAWIAGGVDFQASGASSVEIARTMGAALTVFLLAGAFEEALFRGYILQTFARSGLAWFAILLTAMFFAIVHLGNPNSNWISSLNTGLAGIWFGLAYLKTRDLWFVTGIHVFWNWTQGAIFGIEVSGLTDIVSAPVLKESDAGPVWLTGGDYGLEGGIATTFAIMASTAAIYFLPIAKPDPELLALTEPRESGKRDAELPVS